ncbi:MAG: hypothetical protein GY757_36170, partial [bacterium]|nr:hypothetical protein [bacterium]
MIGVVNKYSTYIPKDYARIYWIGYYEKIAEAKKRFPGNGANTPTEEVVVTEEPPVIDTRSSTMSVSVRKKTAEVLKEMAAEKKELAAVKARTNFQETAFFYPHLKTDKNGTIIIAFTVPEALTQWKMLGIAHTKDLKYGITGNRLVTQKELMVEPNAPRFFREGDTLELTAKIVNLSKETREGKAKLMLFEAATMQPVDAKFNNKEVVKTFKAPKGQSDLVTWKLSIPEEIEAVIYRLVAVSGNYSDGEEQAVPILKNRILVTETMPMTVPARKSKKYRFTGLINSGKYTPSTPSTQSTPSISSTKSTPPTASTKKHHKLTLEITANPLWYAVQALPYLMEYPHQCLEQIFSRYYANSIATHIVKTTPQIKKVFDKWSSTKGTNALLSNLEKNRELKSLLLQETPWVMEAKNETQRKKRIALLFDITKMAASQGRAFKKLEEGQMPSGAWTWFSGMQENRYITQHIVCGLAHLHALKVIDARKHKRVWEMLKKALPYLDRQIDGDYRRLIKREVNLEKKQFGYNQIHYLYARSYFKDIPIKRETKKVFDYYKKQAETYWVKFNTYMQGMIALSLNRLGGKKTATAIIESLKEHAIYSQEKGMYWRRSSGYYWYEAPIETQALLIEAFDEILKDRESVEKMRTWLLKQKQTRDWGTTRATADACYALLLRGPNLLTETNPPEILMGTKNKIKIQPAKMDNVKIEAGTGYFKTSWTGNEITPDMGHIDIKNNNNAAALGAMYWQYFENLDKIIPSKTPLHLKKKLFVEKPTDTGPVLFPLTTNTLKVGDRLKVRIELRVDRNMEYVHMKDMRASGLEPENVISRYKYQDGLGYYEVTKDASTNFFFDYLQKGTYVFEYPLRVSHAGDFSNGITT